MSVFLIYGDFIDVEGRPYTREDRVEATDIDDATRQAVQIMEGAGDIAVVWLPTQPTNE